MTIKTTQKIIKIGDSAGVTIPAKELKRIGLQPGDSVRVVLEPVKQPTNITAEYKAFTNQYGDTLKNLSQR